MLSHGLVLGGNRAAHGFFLAPAGCLIYEHPEHRLSFFDCGLCPKVLLSGIFALG